MEPAAPGTDPRIPVVPAVTARNDPCGIHEEPEFPCPKKFPALEQPFYWKPQRNRQIIKFALWTAGIILACTWFVSATMPVAPGPDNHPWGDISLRLIILVPGLTFAADLVQRHIIRSPPEIADDDSEKRWNLVMLLLVIIWLSFLPPEFTYPD